MRIVYFYAKDGKKIGPLSKEQLDDLHLAPDTLVWHYGLTGWIPYKNLPEPVVKKDESSPFDNFLTWIKSKKKESAPQTEVQQTPVTKLPVESEVDKTVEEPIVKPVAPQRSKQNKNWSRYAIVCVVAIVLVLLAIWAIGKYNAYKAEKQKQEQIRELVQKGDDAMDNALYELASKYYRDALELDSLNWALYFLNGNCCYKQDLYSSACDYYEKAYLYNANHNDTIIAEDSLKYELFLYRYARSLQRAHPCWSKTMEISQEYYSLYSNLSDAYRTMVFAYYVYADEILYDTRTKDEYMHKSIKWAKKMVEKFPYESDSYFCLAYVQKAKGETYKAIENYKRCIELEPGSIAYNNLGNCYEDIGNYQDAFRCWRKAIELGDNKYAPNNLKRRGQRVE